MRIALTKRLALGMLAGSFALTLLLGSFLLTSHASAASSIGSPTDSNIKYIGRWDTGISTIATSYWPGAYLRTDFTGRTVRIRLGSAVNIYVSIDQGADVLYSNANGIVNLTPIPLKAATHSLRIATRTEKDILRFEGLLLDPAAITVAPQLSAQLVEFVGDSITAGATTTKRALSDYAWLIGEQLKVRHTQIAYGGICLTDHVQCGSPNAIGMSRQFFKLQTPSFPTSPNWNFTRDQANVVVINLGTNDNGYHVSNATFQATYTTFLQQIRTVYPHAIILVLRTFKGTKAAPTLAAVNAVNAAGDRNVHYVDTTGWLTTGDYSDSVHPNDGGHVKVAQRLGPIVSSYLA